MPVAPEYLADPTARPVAFDPVSDALRSLRISGSVLLREAYAPPWSIDVPEGARLARLLGVARNEHVVAFHMVEAGQCTLAGQRGAHQHLAAGDVAVCFAGRPHRLADGNGRQRHGIESILRGRRHPRAVTGATLPPGGTRLLCGVFVLHEVQSSPLFRALPPILKSSLSRPNEFHNLAGVARVMAEEVSRPALAGGYIVERLLEVLCAELIRSYMSALPHGQANWLRGVKDPVVGKAIAAVHARPAEAWTVEALAGLCALSSSRFAARFSAAVGTSAMGYVAAWRMRVAQDKLVATDAAIGRVAEAVGYESVPAFTRAFKRATGVSPAAYRHRKAGPTQAG